MNIKIEVINMPVSDLTLDDIYQAMGSEYSKISLRLKDICQLVLEEAVSLAKPTAILGEVCIEGVGEEDVFIGGGHKLTSKLLSKLAKEADKLVLFTMTIGEAIDNRVSEYNKAGNMLEAFVLDAAGSACIAKSSLMLMEELEKRYHSQGMKTTFPMGPGHSYWNSLKDMDTIFHFLKPEKIGMSLTSSNLILPKKSIAMVIGVGENIPDLEGKTHCDFCSLQRTCNMRKFGCDTL